MDPVSEQAARMPKLNKGSERDPRPYDTGGKH